MIPKEPTNDVDRDHATLLLNRIQGLKLAIGELQFSLVGAVNEIFIYPLSRPVNLMNEAFLREGFFFDSD